MQTQLEVMAEEMERQAKVCETVALDKTQESLTGPSADKAINEEDAKIWTVKSQVWHEAEMIVRRALTNSASPT